MDWARRCRARGPAMPSQGNPGRPQSSPQQPNTGKPGGVGKSEVRNRRSERDPTPDVVAYKPEGDCSAMHSWERAAEGSPVDGRSLSGHRNQSLRDVGVEAAIFGFSVLDEFKQAFQGRLPGWPVAAFVPVV